MNLVRVLRAQPVTLSHAFDGGGEDPLTADTGTTVTVTVSRLDGTTVVDEEEATPPAEPPGPYTFTFAGSEELDLLQTQWTGTFGGQQVTEPGDDVEIVGGFFFSLREGRAVDSALSSTTKFPTEDLIARRIEVENEAELICAQAFVPRFAREMLSGDGRPSLILRWPLLRKVRSIAIRPMPQSAYLPMTADQLAQVTGGDDGVLRLDDGLWPAPIWWTWGASWPPGRHNIIVEYEHGRSRPTPDIVRGAKIRFKSLLLQSKSALPDRAERIATTEMGTVLLASPSQDKTGIPEVDAAYARAPDPRGGFG